jgi:response regulator of citrate/malate metabolism
VVENSIHTRLEEIQTYIEAVDEQLKEFGARKRDAEEERKVLRKSLDLIEKVLGVESSNGHAPDGMAAMSGRTGRTVDYPEIKAALEGIGRPATTKEIAEALGTASNMIARKLKYLADKKEIGGDKAGYFALAPTATEPAAA